MDGGVTHDIGIPETLAAVLRIDIHRDGEMVISVRHDGQDMPKDARRHMFAALEAAVDYLKRQPKISPSFEVEQRVEFLRWLQRAARRGA